MRKGMTFQTPLNSRVGMGVLPAPLGIDRQIVQVFPQFFVIRNGQDNGGFFALFVREILDGGYHALTFTQPTPRANGDVAR